MTPLATVGQAPWRCSDEGTWSLTPSTTGASVVAPDPGALWAGFVTDGERAESIVVRLETR